VTPHNDTLSNRRRRLLRRLEPSDPYPEELMHKKTMENTMCDTIREIYRITENEEAKYKLRVAMTIAKKMQQAIGEYKERLKEHGLL
jgi:stress response protein YsnF